MNSSDFFDALNLTHLETDRLEELADELVGERVAVGVDDAPEKDYFVFQIEK